MNKIIRLGFGIIAVSGVLFLAGCNGEPDGGTNEEMVGNLQKNLPESKGDATIPTREDGGGGMPGKKKGP